MLFSLADAATILAAFERLERIEDSILNIETDMATFKETIIAAFAYAKARIAELEVENALLISDDLADEEALADAAEEAAAAKRSVRRAPTGPAHVRLLRATGTARRAARRPRAVRRRRRDERPPKPRDVVS